MGLQQSHPASRTGQAQGLDPGRILGISSTLALNVLALLFLLMPMALMPPPAAVARPPGMTVIDYVPVKPPTPEPPEVVHVVPPRPQTPPDLSRRTERPTPATDAPVLAEQGVFEAEPVSALPAPGDMAPAMDPPGPVAGIALEYRSAPPPAYPRLAMQRDWQGTVLLRVLVGVDGRPLDVSIERSSGHSLLDREAARHVQRTWRFRPAMRDGRPVQAIGVVPIEFRLDRG